jgi:hypothetical protein
MSEKTTTLGSALALDRADAETLVKAAGAKQALGEVPAQILASLLEGAWREIAERVDEALDLPVPDLLAGAWARYTDLWKYCDPDAYPPGKVSVVSLAKHTVRSVHRPAVEVEVSGAAVPVRLRIELQVDLTAGVEGARLSIQAGKIRKLICGTVDFTATLSYDEQEIKKVKHTLTLPGTVSFGEGIPILPVVRVDQGVVPPAVAAEG